MARRPGFLSLLKTVPEMVLGRNEFGVERGGTQRVVTGRIEWNLRRGNWKKIKRESYGVEGFDGACGSRPLGLNPRVFTSP